MNGVAVNNVPVKTASTGTVYHSNFHNHGNIIHVFFYDIDIQYYTQSADWHRIRLYTVLDELNKIAFNVENTRPVEWYNQVEYRMCHGN